MKFKMQTVIGPDEVDATPCRLVPWAKTVIHRRVFWWLLHGLAIEKEAWTVSDIETGCSIYSGRIGQPKVNVLIHAKRKLRHNGKDKFLRAQAKLANK